MPPLRNMRPLKAGIVSIYPPGHPCREMVLSQPDELPEETFRALLPTILALGKSKTSEV